MQSTVSGMLIRTVEVRAIDSDGRTVLDGAGRPICGTAVVTQTDRPGEYDFTVNRNDYGTGQDIEECVLVYPDEQRYADGPVS